MFKIDVVYIFLNLILLFVFIIAGQNVSKGRKYMPNAMLCIIFYALIFGLRYARGDDYFHYQEIYLKGYDEGSQILYVLINDTLNFLGVNEFGFFGVYNFIEMSCGMFFLYKYRKYAKYLFPLFLIATINLNENTIRQGLGFGFVFLCLNQITIIEHYGISTLKRHKQEILKAIIYFTCAYSIHSMCGYVSVLMVLIHFFFKKPIPISISIPTLLFCAYLFSAWFDFSYLNPIIASVAGGDERMASYVENSDRWFSPEGVEEELYARKPIVLIFEMLGTISLYYLGKLAIKKYDISGFVDFYNFFIIGSITLNAFRTLEILNRVGTTFALFWFFPLSIVLFYRKQLMRKPITIFWGVFLIWWSYDYMRHLVMRGDKTLFLWDI